MENPLLDSDIIDRNNKNYAFLTKIANSNEV